MAHQRTVLRTLVSLLFVAATLTGCSKDVDPQAETERLNAFVDEQYLALVKFTPWELIYSGLDPLNSNWQELTPEADAKLAAAIETSLSLLRSNFDPQRLTAQGRTTFRMWELVSADQLDGINWRSHFYHVNQMFGAHVHPSFTMTNIVQVSSLESAEAYVTRLEGIARYLDQATGLIIQNEKKGVLPPKFVFPYVLEASQNVIGGRPFDDGSLEDNIFFSDLMKKLDSLEGQDDEEREALMARGIATLTLEIEPAYRRLIATLKSQERRATDDDGVWKLPDGQNFYKARLSHYTTNSLDAEIIHRIGLDEVARLRLEMEDIKREVGFGGTFKEFSDFVRTDEQFFYSNDETGRQAYLAQVAKELELIKRILPKLFGTLPKGEMEIRAVEKYREASSPSASYEAPSVDGSRPGIYFLNMRDMADLNKIELATLAFHEGLPGHHLEFALSMERDTLPLFRKFWWTSSYSEGWAHYAETLADEAGLYRDDPYARYGYLNSQMYRAIRLVVDTGIHSKKWTREEAIEYFMENSAFSEGFATQQIERYIVQPGQATSYKIGQLKIIELRERARTRLGENFNIRAFHDQILGTGPVPLDFMEELTDKWIEEQASSDQH